MRSTAVNIGDNAAAAQYNDLRKDAFAAAHLLPHEQATPDLTLKVESGICFIGITKVVFAGGNSPSFTAPTTNPRIDLLIIDSAGTLSRIVGTEAASPSVPTYPTDKVVLCEVFNRVGQTTIRDTDVAGQGYIQRDARPFLGGTFISDNSQVAAGASISPSKLNAGNVDVDWLPDADNTRKLGSSTRRWSELRAVNLYGDGANITGIAVSKLEKTYTAGEAIDASTTPQAVYIKNSDGKIYKAINTGDESTYSFVGFVGNGQNIALNGSAIVTYGGILGGFSALTISDFYYIGGTAGAITATSPSSRAKQIGLAMSATELFVFPHDMRVYAGSTSFASSTSTQTNTITIGFRARFIFGVSTSVGSGSTTGMGTGFWTDATGTSGYCHDGSGGGASKQRGSFFAKGQGSDNQPETKVSSVNDTQVSFQMTSTSGTFSHGGGSIDFVILG